MPELISPTTRLRDSWLASRDEWGRGTHQDGSGPHERDTELGRTRRYWITL
jgi:hypothetical protein